MYFRKRIKLISNRQKILTQNMNKTERIKKIKKRRQDKKFLQCRVMFPKNLMSQDQILVKFYLEIIFIELMWNTKNKELTLRESI